MGGFGIPGRHNYYGTGLRTLSNHGVTQEDAGIQESGLRERNLEIGNQGLDYKPGILIYYIFYYVHLAYKE